MTDSARASASERRPAPPVDWSAPRASIVAILVCAGCYLGALAGSVFVYPNVGTPILFPPYAVLTAALLLAPTRQWGVLVLAAAIGNYAAHRGFEASWSFVLLAEVANVLRALVAAGGIRWMGGGLRLETLRDTTIFVAFAVVLGPVAGAFVGAADATLHGRGESYWLVWQTWFLSNALTGLTLLCLFVIVAQPRATRSSRPAPPSAFEATALALGVLVVGYLVLAAPRQSTTFVAGLCYLLPFLSWAAIRFGPRGTVAALSAITALMIYGTRPFVGQEPADGILEFQFVLAAVAVPMLFLAALVQQYAQAIAALRQSETLYRSVVEDQTELICRFLPDGTLTFVNDAYCRYFRRSADELLGRTFWQFLPVEAHEPGKAFLASMTPERRLATTEHAVIAPGGEIRWQQWTDRAFFDGDGRILGYQSVGRDITERKRAEERIKKGEDQLRMFVEHTPAAVAMFDRDMKYVVYSKRWLSDYKLGQQNLIGRSHYEVFPEIPDRWKAVHQRCLAGAIETHDADPFVRLDGTTDWTRWEVRPWHHADGAIGGIIMFTEIVTARKRAEEAWKRFEQRFRSMADQVPVHIWAEDEHAHGVFVNTRYVEYTGMSSEELLKRWPDILHPDDAASHLARYQAAVTQLSEFHSQVRLRRHNGEYHWFDIIGAPYFEGDRFLGYVGCSIDVTERTRAEEERRRLEAQVQIETALRQSEERFRTLADCAPVLIWMSGLQNEGIYFNKPWLDFTGRTLEQELGGGWVESIHPDDRQRCAAGCNEAFARRAPLSMRFRMRRHDGEYRWILDNGVPNFGADGVFKGYIGSCVDITERQQAEEALELASCRKDEFLAMLGHELRNPLAPIAMALEVMRLRPPADDASVKARDVIARQLAQLTRVVDDLLDISRITRGKIRLQMVPTDFGRAITQAIETSRPLILARNHQLVVDVPDEPIPIRGDSVRLAQVVSNLLNNAAKYTDVGGRIVLAVRLEGSQVVLSVTDNGVGIPAHMLERVFDMFAQVENASDRSQGGLGIGLMLVKHMAEMHDGTIEARSEGPGRGSEFVVRLPLAVAPSTARQGRGGRPRTAAPAERASPSFAERKRILVVDDNVDAADTLSRLLRLQEHEVFVAYDGFEALALAEQTHPDVVLLDIQMPKMDGLEVCRRLRRRPNGPRPLLVATTGFGQAEDRRRIAEAGFDHHLIKPLDATMLRSLLRNARPR